MASGGGGKVYPAFGPEYNDLPKRIQLLEEEIAGVNCEIKILTKRLQDEHKQKKPNQKELIKLEAKIALNKQLVITSRTLLVQHRSQNKAQNIVFTFIVSLSEKMKKIQTFQEEDSNSCQYGSFPLTPKK
jgi:predicted  nucleic acid-binding Zn-ribbon protein